MCTIIAGAGDPVPIMNGPIKNGPVMQSSGSPERRRFVLSGRPRLFACIGIGVAVLLGAAVIVAVNYAGGGQNVSRSAAVGSIVRGAASSRMHPSGARHIPPKSATPSTRATPTPAAAGSTSAGAPAAQAAPGPGSASCTDPAFVTSQPLDGWTDGSYYVANNMWNISNYTVAQTLYACSHASWYVVANMNNDSGDGAVKTYPNAHMDFSSEPAISSFHSIDSTFAESSPDTGIYEDAYDIWINGVASSGSTEIMIWTHNHGQSPSGSVGGNATLGGRAYTVWHNGSYIAFVANTNFTSGSMDLLDFFNWVIGQGWMPASSTLGQVDYGAELVSTNGTPATFTFTNFSVSTS
jgi:Glycosyl hydrolase family 12